MNNCIRAAIGEIIGLLINDDTYEFDATINICRWMTKAKYQILLGFAWVYTDEKNESVSMATHYFLIEWIVAWGDRQW